MLITSLPKCCQSISLKIEDRERRAHLLVPHVLVCVLSLLKAKCLLVNDRVNIVGFNSTVHGLELQAGAHEDTTNGADVHQAVKE